MTLHDVPSASPVMRSSRAGSRWVEAFVRRAIQHAAHTAPASLSERLEEEWLADLATRERAMARVRFALACCRATRVIAHELGVPLRAPVAATATANKAPAVCTQTGPAFFSRRTTVSVLIISLHTLVIYGLASGMARQVFEAVPDHMQVSFTKAIPSAQRPQLFDVKVEQLHFAISPPDRIPDIDIPPVAIANVGVQPPQLASSSGTRAVSVIMGGPGPGFPNTADYYPDAARRLGEKGTATIHVCVDGNGRLTADPTIEQTSGSTRLDEGALRLARAGSGHYRATTEDGSPVSGCYGFRIRFALRD